MERFGDRRDWFFDRRFGMFVHWGLYAIPAWHEQLQWRRAVPRAEYAQLLHQFNPTKFDPHAWLDVLQDAGMEYLCFTSKHHDGFCLWDTQYTDFNIMQTPYRRDIVGLLADACRQRGITFCLYYSINDWHHPNYPNMGRSHELPGPEPGDEPDMDRYLEFLRNQVRELCTNYGDIGMFFWDGNVAQIHDPSVNAMVRALQPGAVINNRGFDEGDYDTPERRVPDGRQFPRPTEGNQALGRESWGYKADEDYYAARYLMQSIDNIMARGGNYLLNTGPCADGTLPPENVATLQKIGAWYHTVREAFDGTVPASDLTTNESVLLTRKGNTLYVHLARDPESSGVVLAPIAAQPHTATLLNTGAALDAKVEVTPRLWRDPASLHLRGLPVDTLTDTTLVLKLEFDHLPPV